MKCWNVGEIEIICQITKSSKHFSALITHLLLECGLLVIAVWKCLNLGIIWDNRFPSIWNWMRHLLPPLLALCDSLKAFIKGQIILNIMRKKKRPLLMVQIQKEELRTFKGSGSCLEIFFCSLFYNLGGLLYLLLKESHGIPKPTVEGNFW